MSAIDTFKNVFVFIVFRFVRFFTSVFEGSEQKYYLNNLIRSDFKKKDP